MMSEEKHRYAFDRSTVLAFFLCSSSLETKVWTHSMIKGFNREILPVEKYFDRVPLRAWWSSAGPVAKVDPGLAMNA